MRRFAVALVLVVGCTGSIDNPNEEGLSPAERTAQERWLDGALPTLAETCAMCHDGSMPMVGYLAGTSDMGKRDTLIAYLPVVVNLGSPQSSRLLTHGVHTGPALRADQASKILAWITAERDARPPVPVIETPKMAPTLCVGNPGDATCPLNTIDLTALGAAGATFEFIPQAVGSDLYITNMKFKAGADGLYLTHPIFRSWPAAMPDPVPDPIDRYFNISINLMPNAAAVVLGTGICTLNGMNPADPLTLRFDDFGKYKPPM